MNKPSVLIVDEMHESLIPMLQSIGLEPTYQPKISRNEILECLGNYVGIVIRSKTPLDREAFEAATNLRFIARAGAGLDQIDLGEAKKRGIALMHAPEGNRDAVGEHTIGMLLSLLNKLHMADRQVRTKTWDREGNRGYELMGKTVAIVGYGNMGTAFAKRLRGFDCEVLAYDKNRIGFSDAYAREASLEEIHDKADILSLHIPLDASNKLLVNEDYLRAFRKNIFLLNAARGEVLDCKALLTLLKEGKIRGAALDVLENEKLDKLDALQSERFEELRVHERILFSPHVAGWTYESYRRINEVLVKKIAQHLATQAPEF